MKVPSIEYQPDGGVKIIDVEQKRPLKRGLFYL